MPPALVAASANDLDDIMAVMEEAFDARFGEAWTRAQVASLFVLPGTRVCVAEFGDRAVGFYAARRTGPESELLLLAVKPTVRRMGTGAILLHDWQLWGETVGVIDYFLEMRADNPARRLYEKFGFAECGRRRDYYLGKDGVKRDAVTMRWSTSISE